MNEEEFIAHLSDQFKVSSPLLGIGDDCAVIPVDKDHSWLVTADALVEGVHFLKNQISPSELGYKTMAINVSDIAAMGGKPQFAFLTVSLPKTIEDAWVWQFMEGIKGACGRWNIKLLGGDTVGSLRDIFINVTLIGAASPEHIRYRSQAKEGDILCVTQYLGDSGGGFRALQENLHRTPEVESLIHSHFCPAVSVEHGEWLGAQAGVHAMMDLSDGLNCDLKKLIKQSSSSAFVDIEKIPLSDNLRKVSALHNWDPLELALTGGEDYCLLAAIDAKKFPQIQKAFYKQFDLHLYEIGYNSGSSEELNYLKDNQVIQINCVDFNHF